eukprot:COSAG02_NODE_377_length_23536_cov_12.651065_8_plen_328_part_00
MAPQAKNAVSGGSVRAWGASAGISPPATPLRSPSCTEFGSTGGSGFLLGSSGSSLDAIGSLASTTTAPASPQHVSVSPPKTAPSATSRPKSQSLLVTPEPQPQSSNGKNRPSVAQIMTLTHPEPDDDKKMEHSEQRKRRNVAAPVVCGAPVLVVQSIGPHSESSGPIRRRNRPTSRTATMVKPTSTQPHPVEQQRQTSPCLTPPRLLTAVGENGGIRPTKEVQIRQGPAAHSTVSPAPRTVRGDAPLERNAHDVIVTGPNAGTKATHCRDYTESGIGLDYIPPKYGTSEWEDIATLQGKTRRVRGTSIHEPNFCPSRPFLLSSLAGG